MTEDPVMIDEKTMILAILREAASKEEAELKADRKGNVAPNALMSANGQGFVPKQNHPSNEGRLALNSHLN